MVVKSEGGTSYPRLILVPPGNQLSGLWQSTLSCVCQIASVLSDSATLSPGSSVRGILQARTVEWVTMSCSRETFPN